MPSTRGWRALRDGRSVWRRTERREAVLGRKQWLICCDRDGCINVDVGAPGVIRPEDLHLEHGSAEALATLAQAGHGVVVVTNQSAVAKGLLTEDGLGAIHDEMRRQILEVTGAEPIRAIYASTAKSDGGDPPRFDDWRKPGCGMIRCAIEDFRGGHTLDGSHLVIGDRMTDMIAGCRSGAARNVLVLTSRYGKQTLRVLADARRHSDPRRRDEIFDRVILSESVEAAVSSSAPSDATAMGVEDVTYQELLDALLTIDQESSPSGTPAARIEVWDSLFAFARDFVERGNGGQG